MKVKGQLTAGEIPRVSGTSLSWVGSERRTDELSALMRKSKLPCSTMLSKQSIQKKTVVDVEVRQ